MDDNEGRKVDDNKMKMTTSTVMIKIMWTLIMITVTTANLDQGREHLGKGTWKLADQTNSMIIWTRMVTMIMWTRRMVKATMWKRMVTIM